MLVAIRKPDKHANEQEECIASIVWNTVGDMAVMAESGVRRSGVMLRFEAICTKIDQVRYAPLEPYRECERVRKECQSWQQMVTFFVRTQQHNTWQTLLYGFNNRQKKAFYRLIEAAK